MTIEIDYSSIEDGLYYIKIDGNSSDYLIASSLNISLLIYQDKLLKYNARVICGEVYFKYKEDARKCIHEYIEPTLILNKLIGE